MKIHKYDMFLKNNTRELNAKGYGNKNEEKGYRGPYEQ